MRLKYYLIQFINILFIVQIATAATRVEELASLSLEDLMQVRTSSTGFFAMPVEKAPGSIKVISNEEINNLPVVNLSDIFEKYVPGVHISNQNMYGTLYAARGMTMPDNATTLFMIDGYGINRATGNGVNSGLMLPLLGDIDQIEVLNGPCSIVHGSGSINGFVNISSKTGANYPGFFYETSYGLKEKLFKFEAGYGYSYGFKKDIFIYNGFVHSEGFKFGNNFDYQPKHMSDYNEDKKIRGFPLPAFKWSFIWNHNDFNFKLLFHREKYYIDSLDTYPMNLDISYHATMAIIPEYVFSINNFEKIIFSLPIMFYDIGIEKYDKKEIFGGSERHVEAKAILKTTRFKRHSIALGALHGVRDFNEKKFIFLSKPDKPGKFLETDWSEFGLFFEDIIDLFPKLTLSFGLRYDEINYNPIDVPTIKDQHGIIVREKTVEPGIRNITTSRFAFSYELDKLNSLKFSFQEGFHHPELSHLYYLGNADNELKPEKMESFELTYQHKPGNFGVAFDINLYFNIFKDSLLVEKKNDGEYIREENEDAFTNSKDNFSSTGGEFSMQYKSDKDIFINFSYGYSIPVNISKDDNLKISIANDDCTKWSSYPTHIIKSNMIKNFFHSRLIMGLNFLYNSPVDTDYKQQRGLDVFDHHRILTNIMAKFKINDNLFIKIIGKNIFSCDVPPISFGNTAPWQGNLGSDESYYYIGMGWEQ